MRNAAAVVGIGAATLDGLWLVPQFSDHEGVWAALDHVEMGGGPVATALCVLAHLGRHSALLDVTGDDAASLHIREELESHGVDTAHLHCVRGARPARAAVWVRAGDGARQIAYLPSTAGELQLTETHREVIATAKLLHLNGRHEQAARDALAIALNSGVKVSFDGGAGRYRDSLRDLVEGSHLRIVSLDFARAYSGCEDLEGMLKALLRSPADVVVVTDGVRGSHVALPDGRCFHQPAHAANVVDTTGCGDVYHGAFIHGWLEGWTAEICASFASRWAARNAEGLGGRWVCGAGRMTS